jgi:hypothetical protein
MIHCRVSHLAAYARWKQDDDSDVDWLIKYIRSESQTEAMAKGTAFHKLLEYAQSGVGDIWEATQDGYTFAFTLDADLYLPPMREWRREKDYGGITVSGQVDAIAGNTIWDHKTTERFDAENYLTSKQHCYYLDLFGADRFIWNIWECKPIEYRTSEEDADIPTTKQYEVFALHQLTQYRYPEMEAECRELAHEYAEFARRWLQ